MQISEIFPLINMSADWREEGYGDSVFFLCLLFAQYLCDGRSGMHMVYKLYDTFRKVMLYGTWIFFSYWKSVNQHFWRRDCCVFDVRPTHFITYKKFHCAIDLEDQPIINSVELTRLYFWIMASLTSNGIPESGSSESELLCLLASGLRSLVSSKASNRAGSARWKWG